MASYKSSPRTMSLAAVAISALLMTMAVASVSAGDALIEAPTAAAVSRRFLQQSYSAGYDGCYVDDPSRSFSTSDGLKTLSDCLSAAVQAGSPRFAMQCPTCSTDPTKAECWHGDKGLLGSSPYTQVSNIECATDGVIGLGGSWRNAVWSIEGMSSPPSGPAAAAPSPSSSSSDNAWLVEHNKRRQKYHAMYGVSYVSVKWSNAIEASAQTYANRLIAIPGCVIKHGYQGDDYGGENLASTTASSASADSVLTMWAEDEANLEGYDAGHFIQVVWRPTRYIGCAQAKKSGCTISVCRYIKPGNCGGFSKQLMIKDDSGCGPQCPAEGCF